MKISKLFHWLYAGVMLMPLFAIGFKCLYVTFNPNAKDSYYGETINQEITERVYYNQLQPNETYTIKAIRLTQDVAEGSTAYWINGTDFVDNNGNTYPTANNFVLYINTYGQTYINIREDTTQIISFSDYNTNNALTFKYLSSNNYIQTAIDIFNKYEVTHFYYNDYSYIDNVFYYSVEQISNQPIFNWANNTFLSSPLLYITNLFGVPSTSPIITLLCFWFSVSIIWLVFDMLMYVPLLVHRWLDKGVLE